MKPIYQVASVLFSLLLVSGCSIEGNPSDGDSTFSDEQKPTVQVTRQDITSVLAVSGQTEANSEISLTTAEPGTIRWKVKEGQNVKAGSVLAEIGSNEITSPSDGTLQKFSVLSGSTARPYIPIATFEAHTLGIKVQVPVEDAYRLYSTPTDAMASIESGPSAQDCGLFFSSGGELAEAGEQELPEFVCLLEPNVNSMPGLPAKLGIKTASRSGTLALPVESVSGSSQTGRVTVVSEGNETQDRDVELGISDGNMIEILEGLNEGDVVLAVSPGIFDE